MQSNTKKKTVVVVGGVAGGMSFAARYRRLNLDDEIIVVDKNPYVSFANCGLPYHISEEIPEREDLIVVSEKTIRDRFRIDVRAEEEVVRIVPEEKKICTETKAGEKKEIAYDILVLSPGAKPIRLDIEGLASHPAVFTLRNIPDLDRIKGALAGTQPKSATVIGGGFIGLEVAESLKNAGLEVAIVQISDHVLPPFDPEMAVFAEKELTDHGVKVLTNNSVEKVEGKKLTLQDGSELESDLLLMSVGVAPETGFLEGSGIELGMKDGIKVDEHYRTSVPDIYAIGDSIIVKHTITGEDVMIALAGPANRQGRQLADMLSGYDHDLSGSLGTSIVRIFDRAFASTGLNESQLEGRNYQPIHLIGKSNAGYFPGSEDILLKLIYDKDSREILGAQAVGKKGVDKRIDVIATAIKAGLRADRLQELELSYSPPYGSAKDIINLAGYFAENVMLGLTDPIQISELADYEKRGYRVIDVRTAKEYERGHIDGAKNVPLDEIRDRLDEFEKDEKYVVHCRSSVRSYNAERILKAEGYHVKNLDGSFVYFAANFPDRIVRD